VFGALLETFDDSSLIGHVPIGIVHDSSRPSRRDGTIVSASAIRLSDIMLELIEISRRDLWCGTGAACRYRHVGEMLLGLSALDSRSFTSVITDLVVKNRSRLLRRADEVMGDTDAPRHWRMAAAAFGDECRAHMTQPDFYCPVECVVAGNIEASFLPLRRAIEEYGWLLREWPQLWEKARSLSLRDNLLVS
jgi:hypothetical protein